MLAIIIFKFICKLKLLETACFKYFIAYRLQNQQLSSSEIEQSLPKKPQLAEIPNDASDQPIETSQHSVQYQEENRNIQADENIVHSIKEKIISTMHQAVTHITAYCNICRQAKVSEETKEVEPLLSTLLLDVHSQFGIVKKHSALQEVVESVANQSDIVQALCNFVECAFERLGNPGLSRVMVASLLSVEHWFWDCSQESSHFCDAISQRGMILHFFYQLGELRKNSTNISFVRELMLNTIGVLNSFASSNKYHNQFSDIDYYRVLTPYIYSPLKNLRFASLFTFSSLVDIIPEEDVHFLAIEPAEVEMIVQELRLSNRTDEIHLSGLVFSTDEVLKALANLAALPENANLMVSSSILAILAELFQNMSGEVRQHVLLLIMKLSHLLNKSTFKAVPLQLIPTCLAEKDLKAAIEFTIHDTSKGVMAMRACYKHGEYVRCTEIFEVIKPMLSDFSLEDSRAAKLLYAKALFHVYKKEQRSLSKYASDKKKYSLQHTSCYLKAKEVILKLGAALDYGHLDREGSKFLDLSMIDYVEEKNDLNSCKRCVLCRNKAPLKRSHLWPEALLQLYKSGVESPANHKLFSKIREDGTLTTFSPHQLSYGMFCAECEELFNKNGETQCIPLIKNYIYNESDPSSPSRHLHIRYKEWLYHFCIGLIFRGLVSPDPHVSITSFTNEDEIYELLVLCRRVLLDLRKAEEISDKFQVALLFTPTSLSRDEGHSGFINSLLTSFNLFALSDACLSDGSVCKPREAQFFLAHCGVFNVVVPLGRSHEMPFSHDCLLLPKRGTYSIPPGEDRIKLLPPGIMTFFRLLADCTEVSFLLKPKKLEDRDWVEPSSEKKDVIAHDSGLDEDIEQTGGVVRPSWLRSNPKVLMYLPHSFQIQRPFHHPSSVVLPSGHKILLHHTFTGDDNEFTSTVFLAVGSDKEYSKYNPYIIYHRSNEQGVQINSGFFFSPDTLSPTTFLPDSLEKCLTSYFNKEEAGKLGTKIQDMIQQRGFESIYSLLIHSESNSNTVLDMKCHPQRCWYCRDLCEFCMQLCVVGCEIVDHTPHNHRMYTFCSPCWRDLQMLKSESDENWPKMDFLPLDQGDEKLFPSYSTLLTVKCSFEVFDHLTLSICIGHENGPFILTRSRSLTHQDCAECFVSQDCSLTQPLPYCSDSGRMKSKICSLKDEGLIQSILSYILTSEQANEIPSIKHLFKV